MEFSVLVLVLVRFDKACALVLLGAGERDDWELRKHWRLRLVA